MNGGAKERDGERELADLFALECRIAELRGEWPEGAEAPPEAWLARSPAVAAAYARDRLRRGRCEEAKRLAEQAVKGFARHGAAERLTEAIAWLACVNVRLGNVAEAETALRFLRGETEAGAAAGPDAELALGRGGHLLGLSAAERRRRCERAARSFMAEDCAERSLEALYAWARLGGEADRGEEDALRRLLRQKASWDASYARHVRLLECFDAMEDAWAADEPDQWKRAERAAKIACEGASDDHMRLLHEASRLAARLRLGRPDAAAEAERYEREAPARFPGDLELQAEAWLLRALRLVTGGDRVHAAAALAEAAALRAFGLPPEYERFVSRAEALLRKAENASPGKAASAPVRVRCMGLFAVERAGAPVAPLRWKRKKAQELFLCLLLRPGYSMPREQAVDALFGDAADPVKGSNQLYVVVHELRRVLEQSLGWSDGAALRDGVLRLPEPWIEEVDVEKYTALIRVADQLADAHPELAEEMYGTAAEIYGPLLPDLPYIEWLERLRNELEQKQLRVLRQLYALAARKGDAAKAEAVCERWLELQPLDEEACRSLLLLLVQAGRGAEAKRRYAAFERRLLEEYGIAPLPETKRIVDSSML
ncbi:BTAD domain-containing putative transcriptional regulator [Paenibacillus sp.]|uniref:BTAD domain-containing putative transcriptional regulator n=1 Tax=Paenibacillus sp. TaxID=58172 RepID=UPI002D5C63DE|nr:BTAD domain-containing putative transcriptional regulator [Paenibacillus sp.]HZG88358.1 BTAD domain-containing putative transcriptional regulator [Paenibacillus sp.]